MEDRERGADSSLLGRWSPRQIRSLWRRGNASMRLDGAANEGRTRCFDELDNKVDLGREEVGELSGFRTGMFGNHGTAKSHKKR